MAAKILACVSGESATVARWQRGQLTNLRRFADNASGLAEFEAYLRSSARATIRIVVDSIDDDYRTEILPHASGSDRTQLISRKLRQLFRSSPYSAAGLQERISGRRREDQYLFAAITRPELLSPWLRIVNALRIPISGIYLLPLVTLSVIDRLKIDRPNLLIISKNEAGLRQTFCKQNKMRVSRLTPTREDSTQSTGFYAEEINSTRMYLDALTVTHVDDTVTVLILDSDGSLAGLPDAIKRDRSTFECIRLGPPELEEALGVSAAELNRSADALHLHLLATGRATMNLVPPTLKTRLQVHVIGKAVYAMSAAVIVLGVIWSLASAVIILRAGGEVTRLTQQARDFQSRYQAVTERFPEAPASSQILRDSVEAAKRIDMLRETPRTLMLVLGTALNNSPEIGLKRIQWIYGDPDQMQTGLREIDFSPHLVDDVGQFGIVAAEVLSYEGDHQAALRNIRAFTRQLADDEHVAHVEVIRLPLDLDPNAGLNGSTATRQTSQSAPFEIAVVLRRDAGSEINPQPQQ